MAAAPMKMRNVFAHVTPGAVYVVPDRPVWPFINAQDSWNKEGAAAPFDLGKLAAINASVLVTPAEFMNVRPLILVGPGLGAHHPPPAFDPLPYNMRPRFMRSLSAG